MKRYIAWLVALMFYGSILSWNVNAENFNISAHNVTSDNGVITGFKNITGDNTGNISGFTIDNSLINIDSTYRLSAPYVDVRTHGFLTTATGAANKTALIAAVDALPSADAMLLFPPGEFALNNAGTFISLANKKNIKIVGNGTTINFATDTPFFQIDNCVNVEMSGFYFVGTMNGTVDYTGNASNGQLSIQGGSKDVYIHHNRWDNTAGGIFVNEASENIWVYKNSFIRTHAGVQNGGSGVKNWYILDNYFEGHVLTPTEYGSDDQIGVFSGATGAIIIRGNIIDKKGPTNQNQAHGIIVETSTTGLTNVIIDGNIVSNVITTAAAEKERPAIRVSGSGTPNIARVRVTGNIIDNCNMGIWIGVYAQDIIVSENIINNAVVNLATGSGSSIIASSTPQLTRGSFLNNRMIGGAYGLKLNYGDNVVVIGNTASNMSLYGYYVELVNTLAFIGNIADNAVYDGMNFQAISRGTVIGNHSSNNGRDGIRIGGANDLMFGMNFLDNNSGTTFTDAGSGTIVGAQMTDNTALWGM